VHLNKVLAANLFDCDGTCRTRGVVVGGGTDRPGEQLVPADISHLVASLGVLSWFPVKDPLPFDSIKRLPAA